MGAGSPRYKTASRQSILVFCFFLFFHQKMPIHYNGNALQGCIASMTLWEKPGCFLTQLLGSLQPVLAGCCRAAVLQFNPLSHPNTLSSPLTRWPSSCWPVTMKQRRPFLLLSLIIFLAQVSEQLFCLIVLLLGSQPGINFFPVFMGWVGRCWIRTACFPTGSWSASRQMVCKWCLEGCY